jgi:hypothetical protein
MLHWLQEKLDEHGQGKWEGKQKGKSDERITESKARQKESISISIILLCWYISSVHMVSGEEPNIIRDNLILVKYCGLTVC